MILHPKDIAPGFCTTDDLGNTFCSSQVWPAPHLTAWQRFDAIHTELFLFVFGMYVVTLAFIAILHKRNLDALLKEIKEESK